MAKKATIQKLREDMLITEGSKKTVFPQTIDKAVATKWEGEYKSLDKVLNKKVAALLSYTVKNGEAEEYFLFSFADLSSKKELSKHLTESHADFKTYVTESGIEEDVEELDMYVDSDINSLECFNQRVAFKCVENLYLDKIYLHASNLPEYVLVDEAGNEYSDGDVIMFNSYPGKVYVKLKNINKDKHINELRNILLSAPSVSAKYYIESTSGPQVYNDCIPMNTQWENTAVPYRNYQDPNRYVNGDGELRIATINDIIDAHINGNICFYVLPSDYPSEVPTSELPNSYMAETKKGEIKIEEVVTVNDIKQILFDGIKPIKFTALFLPHPQGEDTPEELPFVFVTHEQTATLIEGNQWANQVFYQGANTTANSTVTISLSMNNNTFKIGLDGWDISQYTNSFTVSAAQLEEGIKIRVVPYAYNANTNAMIPALPVGTTTIDIICTYKNLDTNETTSQVHHIECVVSEQNEAEYNEMVIETTITSPESSKNPIGIAHLTLTGNLSDIWIDKCEVYFYPITMSTFSTEAWVIPGYDFIYSLTGDDTEVPQSVTSLHLTAEELASRNLYLGVRVTNNYKGKAVVLGYIAFTGRTGNNKPISIEIPFDFTSEYSEEYEEPVEQQKEWLGNMHLDYGYIPTIVDDARAINSMFSKEQKGALTTGSLLSVATLKEGEFKDLTNLESADFMQHMGITEIPDECFMNDESLTSVVIPDTVTKIGRHAFLGTALEEVTIPDSVTDIGESAFAGCDNLTTVDIGKSVALLRDTVFEHSSSIADVYLRNDTEPVRISRMLGQNHQLFDAGMTVTLHVPDVDVEITNLDDEVETVSLMDAYTNPEGMWMNIPNVTVNVVAIED